MDNRSEGGGAALAITIVLILLLVLAGGGGIYYFVWRQHLALLAQAQEARMLEAEARMHAEQARAAAEFAAASRAAANDNEPPTAAGDSIRPAVESVLRAQEEAWNRGDVEAFLEHYWKSEELTFSSEGKTTEGWTETLNRYRTRYPTPETMGRLKLSGLEITPLGDSAALVLGQWTVERESEPLSGNFSLIVRKFDDRWLIIHDHTSRKAE